MPNNITETIISFLKQDDWPFAPVPETSDIRSAFSGENGRIECYARILEEQAQFIFYSICPVDGLDEAKLRLAEFLTRANHGLIIGNFEMDWVTGEIRFKTSIDVEGGNLSAALVKNLVYHNVLTMDRYLAAIITVIDGEMTPEEAINRLG